MKLADITLRIVRSRKASEGSKAERERRAPTPIIGGAGGFFDAVGGGGWGPIVTSTLLARGDDFSLVPSTQLD